MHHQKESKRKTTTNIDYTKTEEKSKVNKSVYVPAPRRMVILASERAMVCDQWASEARGTLYCKGFEEKTVAF
jgi:hypothetical protein